MKMDEHGRAAHWQPCRENGPLGLKADSFCVGGASSPLRALPAPSLGAILEAKCGRGEVAEQLHGH